MDRLITNIECGITEKRDFIKNIKYPQLLIKNLKNLKQTIGNDKIKDSIALQIQNLIMQEDKSRVMLHTLLYGPAGVGKTTIGVHLARIWYSLGYLKGKKEDNMAKDFIGRLGKDGFSDQDYMNIMLFIYIIIIVFTLIGYIFTAFRTCCDIFGTTVVILFLIVTIIILVLWYLLFFNNGWDDSASNKNNNGNNNRNISGNSNGNNGKTNSGDKPKFVPGKEEIEDDDLIKVVSREDFVDKYVGWSDKKTLKLLNENLGKVLFIDEAYSLVNGHLDSFGNEVLNALNRFMSEHPGEIIIIMAGYKKEIKKNLMDSQPGLKRRFMWSFELTGYGPEELFLIWKQQMLPYIPNKKDEKKMVSIFRENKDDFPNYAGDTLRLTNYVQMCYTESLMSNIRNDDKTITYKELEDGLVLLRQNNFESSECDPKEDAMKDFISKFT